LKVIIFGAGHFGKLYAEQEKQVEIVAYADNKAVYQIGSTFLGHKVIAPAEIPRYEYDKVVIAVNDDFGSACPDDMQTMDEMWKQLVALGIRESEIAVQAITSPDDRRVIDLNRIAEALVHVEGSVAECGVLRGHFAAQINRCFPDRILYLFDTFSGFDSRDTRDEASKTVKKWLDIYEPLFKLGNERIALARCPYAENVVIRKGYVPDTFVGLEKERFAFVNIDMDLYLPQLNALRFFAPRLTYGGVIQVHDYFDPCLPVVKQAVNKFAEEYEFTRIPSGDSYTVVLAGLRKG
jgi:O-methyltransferase